MRLLSVLYLSLVYTRRARKVFGTKLLTDQRACCRYRLVREVCRVGTHVGDKSVLVEGLSDRHRTLRAEAEFSASLLLKRARCERSVWALSKRLSLNVGDRRSAELECFFKVLSCGLIEKDNRIFLNQLASCLIEITTGCDALSVYVRENSLKW